MLVSALMPTANRRALAPLALGSFAAQDWPEKELIVVDDGEDSIWDLCSQIDGVRYIRLIGRSTIGAKLNLAAVLAGGKILVRWDDDDWSAQGRLRDQAERLERSGKSVTGYHSLLFWTGKEATRCRNGTQVSHGTALCFRRTYWQAHHFPDSSVREDLQFIEPGPLMPQAFARR